MILDLKSTFLFGKTIKIESYVIPPEKLDFGDGDLQADEVEAKIKVYRLENNVISEVTVNVKLFAVCRRCAEKVTKNLSFSLLRPIKISEKTEFLEDEIVLQSHKLDFDELVESDIFARVPTTVLCKEDCRGICQKCYKNLNNESCNCSSKVIDPRLKILENLL